MMLLTYGHGTEAADRTAAILRGAGVSLLVDIRTAPGSRRNPQFARAALEEWLPEAGIAYRWERRLGGWRRARPDSPDTALRNRSFAGYAAHMRGAEFRAAVDELLTEAGTERTAVMCAESVWWRCHRRLIADAAVLLHGCEVGHLFHDGRLETHRPSSEARVAHRDDGAAILVYDVGVNRPLSASDSV